jgi:hypothetical protein
MPKISAGSKIAATTNKVVASSPPSVHAKQPRSSTDLLQLPVSLVDAHPPFTAYIRVPDGTVGVDADAIREATFASDVSGSDPLGSRELWCRCPVPVWISPNCS